MTGKSKPTKKPKNVQKPRDGILDSDVEKSDSEASLHSATAVDCISKKGRPRGSKNKGSK